MKYMDDKRAKVALALGPLVIGWAMAACAARAAADACRPLPVDGEPGASPLATVVAFAQRANTVDYRDSTDRVSELLSPSARQHWREFQRGYQGAIQIERFVSRAVVTQVRWHGRLSGRRATADVSLCVTQRAGERDDRTVSAQTRVVLAKSAAGRWEVVDWSFGGPIS